MSEEILKHLPYEWPVDLIPEIQSFNNSSGSTLVVLDDDPTGTQTVHDIPVLADWSVESIRKEFDAGTGLFYILTNSRSLQEYGASALAREIGRNLLAASALSNRKFRVISRSDSTLRGHYPAEVMALKEGLQMKEVKQVIMPFFLEGGRITVNDIHYVKEGGQLVPVSETPFARDASFGYKNADLKQWIQEKSKGEIESKDVCSISLYDLREKGPLKTAEKIFNTDTTAFVVNAVTTRDAEVAALAFLLAEEKGAVLLYRTAATIVQTLAGLRPRPLLTKGELDLPPGGGSLTIVGSYVPKSTDQLAYITQNQEVSSIHVEVEKVLSEKSNDYLLQQYTREVESCLLKGRDVVIYTSRELVTGNSARESLDIVAKISEFVVKIVKNISLRPRFIIAKGGITSSDIATKALGMKKAMVLGQLLPGVPVWRLDKESRFAGMVYVVFPGNVGEKESLSRALSILK